MHKAGFIRDSPAIEEARARAFGRELEAAAPEKTGAETPAAIEAAKREIEARREALRQRLRHPTPRE